MERQPRTLKSDVEGLAGNIKDHKYEISALASLGAFFYGAFSLYEQGIMNDESFTSVGLMVISIVALSIIGSKADELRRENIRQNNNPPQN